jgi:toxin ParE1/3/4
MIYRVVYTPEAETQLLELYIHLAAADSPDIATRYTDKPLTFCDGLATFPNRGSERNDIRPGLRTIGYRRRVTVAFDVTDETVTIHGTFYGGRDFEAVLDPRTGAGAPEEMD